MKRGTIIFIPFPYTDLSVTKNRPAVVISKPNPSSKNIIVAFITSNVERVLDSDVEIPSIHKEFSKTGLAKSSIIRCDKLLTIDRRIILGEFGEIPDDIIGIMNEKLKNILVLS